MESSPLTMRYVYKNEIIDNPSLIPPSADILCLFSQADDSVVFATTVMGGRLAAIDCFDTVSDSRERAAEIVRLAEDLGVLSEHTEGIPIFIHRDSNDFDLGYPLPDDQTLVAKERFTYTVNEIDRLQREQEQLDRFVVEVVSLQVEGVILKRGFFDANKQLLLFEYPFYMYNEHVAFLELTCQGEQWIRRKHSEDDFFETEELLRYVLPANQDSYFAPLAHHVAVDRAFALDLAGNNIAPEDAHAHELFHLVYCNDDGKPLNSRLLENNFLAQAEVYDVPVEHHDFVLHAMLRQLHSELIPLASRCSVNATHYVRIMAPLSQQSTQLLPLDPGQSKQHISTYYLRGNLITHTCIIYDEEGKPIEERTLTSPTDFSELFRYPIDTTN